MPVNEASNAGRENFTILLKKLQSEFEHLQHRYQTLSESIIHHQAEVVGKEETPVVPLEIENGIKDCIPSPESTGSDYAFLKDRKQILSDSLMDHQVEVAFKEHTPVVALEDEDGIKVRVPSPTKRFHRRASPDDYERLSALASHPEEENEEKDSIQLQIPSRFHRRAFPDGSENWPSAETGFPDKRANAGSSASLDFHEVWSDSLLSDRDVRVSRFSRMPSIRKHKKAHNHREVRKALTGFLTEASGFQERPPGGRTETEHLEAKLQFERLDSDCNGYLTYDFCLQIVSKYSKARMDIERLPMALNVVRNSLEKEGEQALDFDCFSIVLSVDEDCQYLPDNVLKPLTVLATAFKNEAKYQFTESVRRELERRELELKKRKPKIPGTLGVLLDTIPAIVILINVVTLGISANSSDDPVWQIVEIAFVVFYASECILKICLFGPRIYFCGAELYWNWFDLTCFLIAFLEVAVMLIHKLGEAGEDQSSLEEMQFLRILRVARVARLVRTLHFRIFSELKAMILGVFAGLRVLFWAIVLLFLVIYGLGILTNKVYGEDVVEFSTVPAAMLTVFRCVTDGCTAADGSPLHERMRQEYGAIFLVGYVLVFMFVTVGIFNLVMAIFIDNVVTTSSSRKQHELGDNSMLMEVRIKEVIAKLMGRERRRRRSALENFAERGTLKSMNMKEQKKRLLKNEKNEIDAELEELTNIEVTREVFDLWLQDPEMLKMLREIEIDISTKTDLFDVLDVDMGGELTLAELVGGLMRLRGPITKSDIIAVRLKASYITSMVEQIFDKVMNIGDNLQSSTPGSISEVRRGMQRQSTGSGGCFNMIGPGTRGSREVSSI